MKRRLRNLALGLAMFSLATAGSWYNFEQNPKYQSVKRKYLPFLSIEEKYNSPLTKLDNSTTAIIKPRSINKRETIEDQIAELFITTESNIGAYTPGGVLLTKKETRNSELFGRYTAYNPKKTQDNIENIITLSQKREQRITIFDEGEGGYVMRAGNLPAARDIGIYLHNNKIDGTLKGKIDYKRKKSQRKQEIKKIFDEYAIELHDRGVDVVFGPMLDMASSSNKGNPIYRDWRSFTNYFNDMKTIAKLYIDAMHEQGIKTVGKHFLSAGLTGEEDVHEEEATNPKLKSPRLRAGRLYKALRNDLDGVMITHVGNPSDKGRPYSVSKRAYQYLTLPKYPTSTTTSKSSFQNNRQDSRSYRGINFSGLVIVDELSMKGLLDYIAEEPLSNRGKQLIAGCKTAEAKAAVLALDQGAHAFINRDEPIDPLVEGIAYAYKIDKTFRTHVDKAIQKYERFAK